MRTKAFIGLGGNIGSVGQSMGAALAALESEEHTTVIAVSELYASQPWGGGDQPEYTNAVALIDTRLRADELLGLMKDIESGLGREQDAPANSPRPIDLDILLFGDEEWNSPDLIIPHPGMAERDFVITPLLQLAPDASWPSGEPVSRSDVRVGRVTAVLGRVPGYEDRRSIDPRPGMEQDSADDSAPGTVAPSARQPFPGEEWVSVYEYGSDPQLFLGLMQGVSGAPAPLTGRQPDTRAYLAQIVLEQLGIPHEWDPFPPGEASDPYGFTRRFRMVVPASMAPEAEKAIREASEAPIDWSECDTGDASDVESDTSTPDTGADDLGDEEVT